MDKDLKEMIELLKKVFPILLNNPKIMTGNDISEDEIMDIMKTRQLSLSVLHHVAGDDFFQIYHDELNINEEDAKKVAQFLYRSAPYFIDELKEEIPYIKE